MKTLAAAVVILAGATLSLDAAAKGNPAAGKTKAEALKLIRKAIEMHISALNSEGRDMPKPTV